MRDVPDHLEQALQRGAQRVEKQGAHPVQQRQRTHRQRRDDRTTDHPDHGQQRHAVTAAAHHARQAPDIDALAHGDESAETGQQERDDSPGHGGGQQHADAVAITQETHGHGTEQLHGTEDRQGDSDDDHGRGERGHDGRLSQFIGLQRHPGEIHFTILPAGLPALRTFSAWCDRALIHRDADQVAYQVGGPDRDGTECQLPQRAQPPWPRGETSGHPAGDEQAHTATDQPRQQ
ncbi:Uncharacterised protein [Mycobacteroides abscessus subsp. abscessus]|nr:Uncharacterised protein [Mycobacteroides abscessus subsp. abscessus]